MVVKVVCMKVIQRPVPEHLRVEEVVFREGMPTVTQKGRGVDTGGGAKSVNTPKMVTK